MPTIITRRQWGARHDDGFGPAPLPAAEAWLHHSVTIAPNTVWDDVNADGLDDDEVRRMRQIEDIGQQRFGRGFPYTFAVMPSGRVYEGHSANRLGAHTKGHNTVGRGICWVGDYQSATFDLGPMVTATAALLAQGKANGVWRTAALTGGHRDVYPTACPGGKACALIAEINRRAANPQEGLFMSLTADQEQQIYKVLAAAYTRTGRSLGDLLADMSVTLATVAKKVDQVAVEVAALRQAKP